MTKTELLLKLKQSISAWERLALMEENSNLVIGKYNRRSMLDLLSMEDAGDCSIDESKAEALYNSLKTYLDRYMEQTEGHKWVILASIYNAFILDIPLHPIEVTKVKTVQKGNCTEYYCPCRDNSEGSLCHFCVCKDLKN